MAHEPQEEKMESAAGAAEPSYLDAAPMPSARLGNGRYEVIGTSHAVEVIRRRRYWWLRVDGDADALIGPFSTKRKALQFCQASVEL